MTARPKRVTVPAFRKRKREGPPLVVLTAYDAPSALAAEAGGVDALLVGDSLGNVLLGYDTTFPVTMDEMLHHARAVSRARQRALLIADMPWMSYHLNRAGRGDQCRRGSFATPAPTPSSSRVVVTGSPRSRRSSTPRSR